MKNAAMENATNSNIRHQTHLCRSPNFKLTTQKRKKNSNDSRIKNLEIESDGLIDIEIVDAVLNRSIDAGRSSEER